MSTSLAPVARKAVRRVTAPAALLRAAIEAPVAQRSTKRRPTMPALSGGRTTATSAIAVPSPWQLGSEACEAAADRSASWVSGALAAARRGGGLEDAEGPTPSAATTAEKSALREASEQISASVQAKISACSTLAEDALLGEAQSAAELAEMLCDGAAAVRSTAMEALLSIAQCGPQYVVEATADHLEFVDLGLRWRSHEHSVIAAAFLARSIS